MTKLGAKFCSCSGDRTHQTGHEVIIGINPKPNELRGVDLVRVSRELATPLPHTSVDTHVGRFTLSSSCAKGGCAAVTGDGHSSDAAPGGMAMVRRRIEQGEKSG